MSPLIIDDIVRAVLTSQVYDTAVESPLEHAMKLSQQTGYTTYLKREDLQSVHSFKLRGAYNKIAHLAPSERARGVIAASAGNHGQGVALAAKKLGISALIIMPITTPAIKIDAVKSYGAAVELAGESYSEAAEYCKKHIKETGRTFIHPFDDPLVIAGQGTIGREIIEQLPGVTHIFVPVGGGGLIAGIASYVKAFRPDVHIIGVEPEDSNAMQASIAKNKRITLPRVGIFADGVAVKQVGETTFSIAKHKVDTFITVSTDQICAAIKTIFEDTRSIVEPAGALAAAGVATYRLPKNAQAVAICSGANMTFERLGQVAERTAIGSKREALFAVTLPEKPGALRLFCTTILQKRNITELSYRINQRDAARMLIAIATDHEADVESITNDMAVHNYTYTNLTTNELAKQHFRHLAGGQRPDTTNEHIYEIVFPERPGALIDFLSDIAPDWNISLFHYRYSASDWVSVLIGFETTDTAALEAKLADSSYEWKSVENDGAIKQFL